MKIIKVQLTYDEIQFTIKTSFKNYIKKTNKKAALEYLNKLTRKHTKVKGIEHDELKIQAYFSADECEIIF